MSEISELSRILSAASAEADAVPAEFEATQEHEGQPALQKIMYTRLEAAYVMSVSEKTITRFIKAGLLPAVRIGQLLRIRREDIDELAASHLEVTP